MQTPNHIRILEAGADKPPGSPGIVGGYLRVYTEAEKALVREKVAAEVSVELAEKLKNAKGWRRWWMKWRMKSTIESRTARSLYGGI